MPRMSNSHSPPPSTTIDDDDDEDDNDDDGEEVKGLTSSSKINHKRRRQSKYYDDLDYFDRDDDLCRRYCCSASSSTWKLHPSWKMLLLISSCFLILAWVFIDDKIKKHHDRSYIRHNELWHDKDQEPLKRDNVIGRSKNIDDVDDYYESSMFQIPVENHHDHSSSSISNNQQDPTQPYGIEDKIIVETVASAAPSNSVHHQASNTQFNKFVGIDTISVLGICERHPSIDWLVDRLKKLYPDMRVMSGFPLSDDDATKKPAQRALQNNIANHSRLRSSRRFARVIDPTSNKVIRHFGNDVENDSSDNDAANRNDSHQKSKTGNILVVAVSVNPYAWVELMRVDSQNDPMYAPTSNRDGGTLGWEEYVKAVLPSVNGTILDLRSKNILSAVAKSEQHDGVRLVIPLQFEDLVEPYSNYDNFVSDETLSLPGIVGLLDQIQARTGLRADESSGWQESAKEKNDFWADPVGCRGHICFPSVNKISEDLHYVRYMNEHIDWSAEQLIGYYSRSEPKPSVDRIVVLGNATT